MRGAHARAARGDRRARDARGRVHDDRPPAGDLGSAGRLGALKLKEELPVLGTCAGLILLASEVLDGRSRSVELRCARRYRCGATATAARSRVSSRRSRSRASARCRGSSSARRRSTQSARGRGPRDLRPRREGAHPVLVRQGRVWGAVLSPRTHERHARARALSRLSLVSITMI